MEEKESIKFLEKYFRDKNYRDLLEINKENNQKNLKDFIRNVEKMMSENAGNITYTQIRNVLQIVKNKEFENDSGSFIKVIPNIAYMEARLDKGAGKPLLTFIRETAMEVDSKEDYKSFLDIMNTLVAYHKLYG